MVYNYEALNSIINEANLRKGKRLSWLKLQKSGLFQNIFSILFFYTHKACRELFGKDNLLKHSFSKVTSMSLHID